MYKALTIADMFLARAFREGKQLNPMQVQKLVYLAHGWYLAIEGKPLLNEQVEAWPYGPVIPSVYHEFKGYGNQPIPRGDGQWDGPEEIQALIDKVWEVYKGYSGPQLSAMTHRKDSPWDKVYQKDQRQGTDIPSDVIEEHFIELAGHGQSE